MWGIDEDYALREKLQGFTIPNYASGPSGTEKSFIPPVFFGSPDPEERQRTYPHIQVNLIDIQYAEDRAHRAAEFILNYDLETATPNSGFDLVADDFPTPWSLIYQITAYSRNPWHDRMFAMMFYQMFPQQYGSLNMANFDGTLRRADLVDVVQRDAIDNKKRLYRKIVTVAISSEFFLSEVIQVQQAISTSITFTQYTGEPQGLPV
jgi:hypothetical protein